MWTARTDYRDSDNEDRRGFATSVQIDPRADLGALVGIRLYDTHRASGEERFANDVRLGVAYRPLQSRWIVLDRLEWIREDTSGGQFEFDNWRIVNNLNLNCSLEPKWQLGFLYGSKYVRETIDETEYDGYIDVTGLETRYDLTPRWDIGVRGSVLHAWDASQYDYSAGASVGHSLFRNVWISLGYNVIGFEDRDFSRADATAEGAFLRFRIKFDQASIRDLLGEAGR